MIRAVFFVLLLLGVAAGAVGGLGWYEYQRFIKHPINVNESSPTFAVQRGWSVRRVAEQLQTQGVIANAMWFEAYARFGAQGQTIKAGEYVLQPEITVPELFATLSRGQTVQYTHSIIEGLNWKQTMASIARSEALVHTLEADSLSDPQVLMQKIGVPDRHPEGQFFADTYAFPRNTTDIEYLQRAHRMLNTVLEDEWANRQEGLPFSTPYEALILASIIEKETALASERPLIAGVFVSRLRKNMRLQTDPTVIYGIGDAFDGDIRRRDLTTDTPYNTYTRGGLPPTPIAMVGREAIHAALNPESTTALYFVSRGDGSHYFSETLDEHNAAVRKYQLGQ